MTDEHPFGNEVGEWVDVVYALRTFVIWGGQPQSVVMHAGHWDDQGQCTATCLAPTEEGVPPHEAPGEDCRCGIYGTFTLRTLRRPYGAQARWIVAVIQCEGSGSRGPKGIRAARATVVAFWCPQPDKDDEDHEDDIALCLDRFPHARQYRSDLAMALAYRLGA